MKQDIENIIRKWLKEHKDGGQWVDDYDGEFNLDSCCLDGWFDLEELSSLIADEVLKVVVEKIEKEFPDDTGLNSYIKKEYILSLINKK